MWGMKPAHVEEPFCRFRSDPYCQFECGWKPRSRAAFLLERFGTRKRRLFDALAEIEKDNSLLRTKFRKISALNAELQDKVERLQAINRASRVLASCTNVNDSFERTCASSSTCFASTGRSSCSPTARTRSTPTRRRPKPRSSGASGATA